MREMIRGLSVAFVGVLFCALAYAGSAAVGSVAGSVNATMSGRELIQNSTIFSGDSLQVKEGVAVIALGHGNRMVFGSESTVSFSRETDAVTAVLGQGNVSLFSLDGGAGMRVKVGEVTIAPAKGFKTMGEVAMANGSITVATKEGLLRIEGDGQAVDVAKGKTIAVMPKAARSPRRGGGGSGHGWSGLDIAAVGVGATAVGLGAWAIHDASNAKDSANASIAAANAAATAATAAANAAAAAQAASVAAGCALNQLANHLNPPIASPYTPPAGSHC